MLRGLTSRSGTISIKMAFKTETQITTFNGKLLKLSHQSEVTNTKMDVNVFLPSTYQQSKKTPVLFYLSGLTCTPNNASEKGYFFPWAEKFGFALVFPDTSPRGAGVAGEDDSWDFGTGAGFYVDATEEPYSKYYNMYSYVTKELHAELSKEFGNLDFDNVSITGHSMGGFGALQIFLKNEGKYKSVSAFAPISNPSTCPWGEKNFGNYLGGDKSKWAEYDPSELIKKYQGPVVPILIHQGKADQFYKDGQLQPEKFVKASEDSSLNGKVDLHLVEGYDHSYFFISSFAEEHARHHAKYLGLSTI